MQAPISEQQFIEQVVPSLAQGKHIKEADARVWYQSVMKLDPERLGWHIARLNGLGGSDVGEIVAWKLGVFNVFKTPRDIIDEKLLRKPIQQQTKVMRRGTYLESVIQQFFLEDFNATSRTDLAKKIDAQTDPKHPWLRGNVDDVVEINGYIFVVDYKSPTKAKASDAALQYAGQVHQYGHLLGLATGEPAHSHIVASFDYAKGEVVPVEVPYDQEVMDAVLDGGDEIWNHVLNGTHPELNQFNAEDNEYSEEQAGQIAILEEEFIRYKLLADAATGKQKELAALLVQKLNNDGAYTLKGQKVPLEVLTGSAREKLDDEQAHSILATAGVDPAEFMVPDKNLDEAKVMEALAEHCGPESLESFYLKKFDKAKVFEFCDEKGLARPVNESYSVQLRASKKGLDKEVLADARYSAQELVISVSSRVYLGEDDQEMEQVPPAA